MEFMLLTFTLSRQAGNMDALTQEGSDVGVSNWYRKNIRWAGISVTPNLSSAVKGQVFWKSILPV